MLILFLFQFLGCIPYPVWAPTARCEPWNYLDDLSLCAHCTQLEFLLLLLVGCWLRALAIHTNTQGMLPATMHVAAVST